MTEDAVFAYICVKGGADAIDFYARAFGAEERSRMPVPSGELSHAELRIGKSILFLADEYAPREWLSPQTLPGRSVGLVLVVDDCQAVMQRAVDAGGVVERPVDDQPGGRGGWLIDPFGHHWNIMTPEPGFLPAR